MMASVGGGEQSGVQFLTGMALRYPATRATGRRSQSSGPTSVFRTEQELTFFYSQQYSQCASNSWTKRKPAHCD